MDVDLLFAVGLTQDVMTCLAVDQARTEQIDDMSTEPRQTQDKGTTGSCGGGQ